MLAKLWHVLTSFQGRISRKWWWIGFVIWFVANVGGGFVLNPDYFLAEEPPPPNLPDTLWQIALLVPLTAITVKRFNDREWPWWLGYALTGPVLAQVLASHFGIRIDPGAQGIGAMAFWGMAAVGLFALIDNGFVRGTDGPNRYGPDPLAPSDNPTA